MRKYFPPEIEDVTEPFCGCRRRNMIPLSVYNQEIAMQWCYERNCGWGPEDFSRASTVKAWWICTDCRRVYKSQINCRVNGGTGCPYCASKRPCEDNSLASLFPETAREWHPTKNGKLTPASITFASRKKVWWLCKKEHSWQAMPADRTTSGSGCPHCYEERMQYAREHPPPRKRGHVILDEGEEVSRKWYDSGDYSFIPLSKSHPEIARQWHPTRNKPWTPKDFAYGSEARAWWKCKEGPDHEWQSPIYSRTGRTSGCPFCANKQISVTNSLAGLHPELASQWHKELNGSLNPTDVLASSTDKAWWLCPVNSDHVWSAAISRRSKGRGCPFCASGVESPDLSLRARYPDIASQWHASKNGDLRPEDVFPGSGKMIWWTCPQGPDHHWPARVSNRTIHASGCPFCTGRKASVTNSLAARFPKVARQWHKTKNGGVRPSQVTAGSSKLYWWLCPAGHSYQQTACKRTTRNYGCPKCRMSRRG